MHLNKKSVDSGELLSEWKEAIVSPIFKKGLTKIAVDHRPVSLTLILCKQLKSFVREAITDHMTANSFLNTSSPLTQKLHVK